MEGQHRATPTCVFRINSLSCRAHSVQALSCWFRFRLPPLPTYTRSWCNVRIHETDACGPRSPRHRTYTVQSHSYPTAA